jgi:hypothetical protein
MGFRRVNFSLEDTLPHFKYCDCTRLVLVRGRSNRTRHEIQLVKSRMRFCRASEL